MSVPEEQAELLASKQQCPCEDPGNAFAIYSDGHGYCFSGGCPRPHWSRSKLKGTVYEDWQGVEGDYTPRSQPSGSQRMPADLMELISQMEPRALTRRGITQATARHWDYRVGINAHGEAEEWALYHDDTGVPIAAKVRNKGKDGLGKSFLIRPNPKQDGIVTPDLPLYGQHRLSSKGGPMVVVCEGEIDTLTCSQLWGNKFPVVGVPYGSDEKKAAKAIAKALPLLSKYDRVIFAFDMDEPGRAGCIGAARMMPPGKAFIANIPGGHKDINEAHLAGEDQALISALHNAPAYRPDGIVAAKDLVGQALNPIGGFWSMPWPFLTRWTKALPRGGNVIINGAGTGVGKSDQQAQICEHLLTVEQTPCFVSNYEAGPVRTLKGIAGKHAGQRFHIPQEKDGDIWHEADLRQALDDLTNTSAKLFINDHYGEVSWSALKERVRYLARSEGVTNFFIDPVAALVAQEDDDRKALDRVFAESKSLAEELYVNLWFNSHLTRPSEGKSHEEGGRVTLKSFRGSGAIVMWASLVMGMERDQQSEDENERTITTIRCLKERETGDPVGQTERLKYNTMSGMLEVDVSVLDESQEVEPGVGISDDELLREMTK